VLAHSSRLIISSGGKGLKASTLVIQRHGPWVRLRTCETGGASLRREGQSSAGVGTMWA